jgi:hypothetical protein
MRAAAEDHFESVFASGKKCPANFTGHSLENDILRPFEKPVARGRDAK